MFSVKTIWDEERLRSIGDLQCVMFDRSIFNLIDNQDGPVHLLLSASTEYGDLSTFVIPNFKTTSWSWGIAVDDLVSEEYFTFEGDEPKYWEWANNQLSD